MIISSIYPGKQLKKLSNKHKHAAKAHLCQNTFKVLTLLFRLTKFRNFSLGTLTRTKLSLPIQEQLKISIFGFFLFSK